MTMWIILMFLTSDSTYSPANMMAYPQLFTSEASCLNRTLDLAIPPNYDLDCVPVYVEHLKGD